MVCFIFYTMEHGKEFGRIRKILFPIYNYELRKVLPLFFMFMLIACAYYILRSLKDMLLMSYLKQAEAIYFLKVYGVTPFMVLLTLAYARLSNYDRDKRFFIVVGYFLVIISTCYFFLIPNLDVLKLDTFTDHLNAWVPAMKPLWESIRFWPCSLIYLNAEAWGSMAIGVLFWTLANDITSFKQAKRVYGYLSMGAALGTTVGGALIAYVIGKDLNEGTGIAIVLIAAILVIYYFFARDIKANPELYQVEVKAPKKNKVKLSMMESFKFLAKSKHLALIAILVLSYGAFMSLFESVAKAQFAKLSVELGDSSILTKIYGYQGMANGALSILLVFLSGWFAKRGWRFTALTTPIVGIVCSGIFFLFLFGGDLTKSLLGIDSADSMAIIDMLWVAVIVGAGNVVFIKAAKYVMFDPTCNQAYIPLDEESKVTGKAAVDGVGSRLGKSIGSLLISAPVVGLVGIFGSIDNAKFVIAALVTVVLLVWIHAVTKLSRLLKSDEEKNGTE